MKNKTYSPHELLFLKILPVYIQNHKYKTDFLFDDQLIEESKYIYIGCHKFCDNLSLLIDVNLLLKHIEIVIGILNNKSLDNSNMRLIIAKIKSMIDYLESELILVCNNSKYYGQ